MTEADRKRWNEKYGRSEVLPVHPPDDWLLTALGHISRLSMKVGKALDLACGTGHNAIWLASHEWQVDAVDISSVGLAKAQTLAQNSGVDVNWIEADLDTWDAPAGEYDLVAVFRFLDRESIPRVVDRALRPGGLLVYETFSAAHCSRNDSPMKNQAFALADGELKTMFPNFSVLEFREDELADRSVQRFIGRRH